MRLGNLVLSLAALGSLMLGAVAQNGKREIPFPIRLFQQATADDFIGDQTCAGCHAEQVDQFKFSGHATYMYKAGLPIEKQGCEGCHGPGQFHLDEEHPQIIAFNKLSAKDVTAACMRCHQDLMTQAHWDRGAHGRADISCVQCHQIHPSKKFDPEEEDPNRGDVSSGGGKGLLKREIFPAAKLTKALLKMDEAKLCGQCHQSEVNQFRLNSHHPIPEGRMQCSDCHTIHPSREDKKRIEVMMKDKCVECHAEVAGPHAFEHDPVAGWTGDACMECHRPHGSQNPKLLRAFSRGLCGQCHTEKMATHFPGRTCWSAGCHVAVHGSNTDPRLLQK